MLYFTTSISSLLQFTFSFFCVSALLFTLLWARALLFFFLKKEKEENIPTSELAVGKKSRASERAYATTSYTMASSVGVRTRPRGGAFAQKGPSQAVLFLSLFTFFVPRSKTRKPIEGKHFGQHNSSGKLGKLYACIRF